MPDALDKRGTDDADPAPEADYGFGRSAPLSDVDRRRIAREQGDRIADGRARQGHIVLRTPISRAFFAAGLIGAAALALAVFLFAG